MHAALRFETRAIHAGQEPDPSNGAVMTPVYFTSTYKQDAPAEPRDGYEYSRTRNPTRTALEENLAALEGGASGLGFASGLAATNALCDRLRPGDHVVAGNDLYGGTYRLFTKRLPALRHRASAFVDTTRPRRGRRARCGRRRATLFLETPTNPLLRSATSPPASRARARGAARRSSSTTPSRRPTCSSRSSSAPTSCCTRSTKYLGGHSDVVGGALVGNDAELRERARLLPERGRRQPGPMDAFLVLRGTKTLARAHGAPLRERARASRERLASTRSSSACSTPACLAPAARARRAPDEGLRRHGLVRAARRRRRGATRFATATRLFTLAESLGGVESLVEVPAAMTHASIPAEDAPQGGPRRTASCGSRSGSSTSTT